MKIKHFAFLLFLLPNYISSQIILKGKILDNKQQPIQSASVTLSNKNSNIILAFSISDKNGLYSVSWHGNTDSLMINVSALGYSKKEMIIPPVSASIDFLLEPKAIELKEVQVKSPPPVWQRKDTINYNVAEFKQPQDRVIGDIISRLPGIEVTPGGQIKYNGKPINKYYIEGLDLLEDRYGIANNNIPAESVDKVQVLENHQPIRVLDSIAFSDRAALNIKLKSNAKMKLIGRAKAGIGISPFLSEDELVNMLFKKKLQFINTYKYNNTGLDNSKELTSQNINEYINAIQNGAIKSDLVSLVQPNPPSISQKRYLFNNAHVISVNQLLPLTSIYQLRINASYANDFQKQQSSVITKYYLPDDTISIHEQNNYYNNLNLLQTDFSLIANTPRFYLKNLLRFQSWWSSENSMVATNTEINQHLSNPFFNVSNDFSLLKTRKKTISEWHSYIGYVSLPQSLQIMPGLYAALLNDNIPYDALFQKASMKTFYTDNYLSLRKRKSKFGSQYKFGFNMQSQHLFSDLMREKAGIKKSVADSFQNNLYWQRYRFYNENSWTYETTKFRIAFTFPVNYIKIDYKDTLLKVMSEKNRFFLNPVASFMWQLDPKWSLAVIGSYNEMFNEIRDISRSYILKNYRNLSNNKAPLAENNSINLTSTVTFRNPLKIVFFNTGVSLSKNKSSLLYNQVFNGNLETLIALLENNYSNKTSFFGRFNKYIIDWKTSITLNGGYTFGSQQQLQQDKLITFSNKNYNFGSTISTKLSSKVTADYNIIYFTYFSKSQLQQSATKISFINQNLSFNYFPDNKIIFSARAEHYNINNSFESVRDYYFADINLRYKPSKSRIDYELGYQNILNTKSFTTGLLLNNVETVSVYTLRPAQVLFKINFPF